jgi:hypothetical protein
MMLLVKLGLATMVKAMQHKFFLPEDREAGPPGVCKKEMCQISSS